MSHSDMKKKKKNKGGRPEGSKNKNPKPKATAQMVKGQIFIGLPPEENPFLKAIRENLKRTGGGRPRVFATPKVMLEAMELYVRWATNNPIQSQQLADGKLVTLPLRRPITLEGYCLFCGVTSGYLRDFRKTIAPKEPGFTAVMNTIEEYITGDLFEGAAAGQFNANLISKKLGLADSVNVNHGIQKDQVAGLFPFAKPKEIGDGN